MAIDSEKLKKMTPPKGMAFHIHKVGHVVLQVTDLERSTEFYTKVLGFVEFRDPDNHSLELYWGVDQVGSDGRVRPSNEWRGVRSLEEAIINPVPGQDTPLPR